MRALTQISRDSIVFTKKTRRNEVTAREGIDTYSPSPFRERLPCRNEVTAREGIDTEIYECHKALLPGCRNEVTAREGIDTMLPSAFTSSMYSVEMR
ncbi:Uncharacterised protein [uncultured Lachnospira sp.]|nr:Uncharacterised protein [uncultured Lachnospira sp.]